MSASGAFVSQQPPRQQRAGVHSHACGSRCVSPCCAGPDALLRPSRAPRRTRAKDACGDTSAECYVRQRQAAKAGVDACVCCDTKCCAWASAHVTWLRGEGSAASLDASEASFRAAVEVRWLCLVSARHIFVPTALTPRLHPQADPNNAAALAAYAIFVHDERGDKQLASKLFEQAAELAPMDLDVLASWAFFAMLDE